MYILIWLCFCFTNLITVFISSYLWMKEWYFVALSICGLASVLFGLCVVVAFKNVNKIRNSILVVIGLAVAQWWFIEIALMQLIGEFRGFAP
jgi:hypothetical protein